tara:strand:- start:300 stop:644 length:345 start_codon:yes stop_codon:yes gene_type:complete
MNGDKLALLRGCFFVQKISYHRGFRKPIVRSKRDAFQGSKIFTSTKWEQAVRYKTNLIKSVSGENFQKEIDGSCYGTSCIMGGKKSLLDKSYTRSIDLNLFFILYYIIIKNQNF